ncbi:MAG: hypothetical protein HY859_07015 [Caulobacterales bacterium]|nr:hypothetical protein [Caulobacterales bacterium]
MKFSTIQIAAAALIVGTTLLVGAAAAQGRDQHRVGMGGIRCIPEPTISRNPMSNYYEATWYNNCSQDIRIHYTWTRTDGGGQVNDYRTVPAWADVTVVLVTQPRLDDWYEVF